MNGHLPFHEGELAVQERLGEQRQAARNGQAISDGIILGAIPFIRQQPMLIVGSGASDGSIWASILIGEPGWMHAPDGSAVELDLGRTRRISHDPLWTNLASDPRVGLLIIEFATRRRIRINGKWTQLNENAACVDVVESYPNCPKYIQKRIFEFHAEQLHEPTMEPTSGVALLPDQVELIGRSDTFFAASGNPQGQLDASHRGGPPGFVQVIDERTLRVPDYSGNSMYNTLGNWMVDPRAGLLFYDIERHRTIQMTGAVEVLWSDDPASAPTGGTSRFWTFRLNRWVETHWPPVLTCERVEYSPYLPA